MLLVIYKYDIQHVTESSNKDAMPYAPEQKQKSRNRILDAAMGLFKARGFGDVSIDEIMAEAGLTRGAFYAHFKSKDDLVIESFRAAAATPPPTEAGPEKLLAFVDTYVSALHRDNPAGGCCISALTADVAREGPEARAAYTEFLRGFSGIVDTYLGNDRHALSDDALAIIAQMVGTVQIARAVNDPMLSTRLLKAGRQAVNYLLPPEDDVA